MEPLADAPLADAPLADAEEIRRAMEYYDAMGWTDGLPVVPVTESYLAGFLASPRTRNRARGRRCTRTSGSTRRTAR
ncbi:MAG TPA: hypothetical protein VFW50_20350 [Streptosporangiaceae bacterium]|nr:hypothetical protein [Streptosporangiaceae bacterium]